MSTASKSPARPAYVDRQSHRVDRVDRQSLRRQNREARSTTGQTRERGCWIAAYDGGFRDLVFVALSPIRISAGSGYGARRAGYARTQTILSHVELSAAAAAAATATATAAAKAAAAVYSRS